MSRSFHAREGSFLKIALVTEKKKFNVLLFSPFEMGNSHRGKKVKAEELEKQK